MKTIKSIACLSLGVMLAVPAFAQQQEQDRVKESAQVLKEILQAEDKGVPHDLMNKAECVVIYPSVKKAAFVVGGSYGRAS